VSRYPFARFVIPQLHLQKFGSERFGLLFRVTRGYRGEDEDAFADRGDQLLLNGDRSREDALKDGCVCWHASTQEREEVESRVPFILKEGSQIQRVPARTATEAYCASKVQYQIASVCWLLRATGEANRRRASKKTGSQRPVRRHVTLQYPGLCVGVSSRECPL